jgi:hypothetical protein
MAIADHQIDDLASFKKVTSAPHRVAGLYFFQQMDCLVDLAHRVAHDFYDRPELFTDLNDAPPPAPRLASTLAALHARSGCDERFLNKTQRRAIFSALFGADATMDAAEAGNFARLRDELLEACAVFVETKFGDEAALRENVRQKHRLFKEYLTGLDGASVAWSRDEALAGLTEDVSYRILRNKGVAAVYGIATPARDAWPYTFDSNADKLIEKISMQLMRPDLAGHTSCKCGTHTHISREEITNLQRVAIEGAKAIATAIDVDAASTKADIDRLIMKCYTWGTALRNRLRHSAPLAASVVSPAATKPRGALAIAQPIANPAFTAS